MNKFSSAVLALVVLATAFSLSSCEKTYDQPPGPADLPIVPNSSIASLKALHSVSGRIDPINADIIVSGIVTANDKTGNLYKQIFIEDSTGALQILLDASGLYTTFPVGRRVYVYCKGLAITDYNGMIQLGALSVSGTVTTVEAIISSDISNRVKGGSINNPVNPVTVTLAQLGTGMQNAYVGRLVKLEGFEFTPRDTAKTYADTSAYRADQSDTIQDCANNKTIIRTSGYADFAGLNVPNGNGDLIAIYTVYRTTKQFLVRDTSDVKFYNPRCGALPPGTKVLLQEDFETQTVPATAPYNPVTINGWVNVGEVGGKVYDARTFGGNKYAYLSAFGTNQNTVTTWLVTRGVNLDTTNSEVLTFKTMQGFISSGGVNVQSAMKILISTNYTGAGDPWATGVNWTDITSQAALSPGSPTSSFPSSFTASGNISLAAYSGTIYVAFRYEGSDPTGTANDKTSAWEVDDILITGL